MHCSKSCIMAMRAVGVFMGVASVITGLYFTGYFEPKCHALSARTMNFLGTKTPYLWPEWHDVKAHPPSKECTAEQMWIIVRHGSRLPGEEVISKIRNELPAFRDSILKNHVEGRGALCKENLESLKSWTPHPGFLEEHEKWLIPQGEVEIEGIANRYKKRYPNLFGKPYTKEHFKLKYTKTQRAEASANFFAKGLFPDNHKDVWYPTPLTKDPILRFYKSCEKWQRDVDDNSEAYKEREIFETTPRFRSVLDNVRNRLGFQRNLSTSEVELLYTTCAFETAWHPDQISKWCTIFDENDFKALLYRSDVKYYWIDGYGYELTYRHACAPIQDVISQFQNHIDQPTKSTQVTAYFTHSGTLLKLISRLGLFNDSIPLLGSNYDAHLNRKWRTGDIDKFATNLAFILFKCSGEYKVGTYFQEEPIELEACGDYTCSFDKFKRNLLDTIGDCDVNAMCKI